MPLHEHKRNWSTARAPSANKGPRKKPHPTHNKEEYGEAAYFAEDTDSGLHQYTVGGDAAEAAAAREKVKSAERLKRTDAEEVKWNAIHHELVAQYVASLPDEQLMRAKELAAAKQSLDDKVRCAVSE